MHGAFSLFIVVALASVARAAPESPRATTPFGLKEVLDGTYSARGIGTIQWVSDEEVANLNAAGNIVIINFTTEDTDILIAVSELNESNRNYARGSWSITKDKKFLLWSYDVKAGFRHSTEAIYAVYDINGKNWTDLHDGEHLHFATWSPSGEALAYVHQNDVYYVHDVNIPSNYTRITYDGEEGKIYNGVPDWVYEEEVLSSGSAMWFSPEGNYLAFATFDDTDVKVFKFVTYEWEQYTKIEEIHYPKAGDINPTVTLSIVNLTAVGDEEPLLLNTTGAIDPLEHILQNVGWAEEGVMVATWMNRTQNYAEILSYRADDGWAGIKVYDDAETQGWVEVGTPVTAFGEGVDEGVALLLPQEITAFKDTLGRLAHPAILRTSGTGSVDFPLSDASVATVIYGWNKNTGYIYYQAAPAGLPSRRHVYAVHATDNSAAVCLTCSLKQKDDEDCLYASANMSPSMQRAVVTCSGPGPAMIGAVSVKESDPFAFEMELENNAAVRTLLQNRDQVKVISRTVPLAGDFEAQVRLWLPPDLEEDGDETYPMLVYVYGGPGSQQVSDAYTVNWGHYLATSEGIIYALIDGRGSGLQGNRLLHSLYLRLGTVEVTDQIDVARFLAENLTYVDEERVGIWGWSYGGYATAMALALDTEDVLACGASVAPVTSWELYDTIYTERYMRTPLQNTKGYEDANVTNKIGNFAQHRFYLLHGNADDNVHYQQAMWLARALEEGDILFQQMSYPDENHRIASVLTHVYLTMTDFFEQCFAPAPITQLAASFRASTLLLSLVLLLLPALWSLQF